MTPIKDRFLRTGIAAALLLACAGVYSQDCPKVKLDDFPKADLPNPFDTSLAMKAKLKEQGSYKFYYGIGVKVDYIRARQLAFIEMALNKEDEEDPFGGASILMMLYANGFGVKRNLDLSIRLACANVGFADAEIEGRVDHLRKLRSGELTGTIDICDDITSGYMMGFCSGVHAELADIERKAFIDSLTRTWPEKDQEAYKGLRQAASDFFTARVMSEVNEMGTARVAEQYGEQETLEEGFKQKIVSAAGCGFSPRTGQQLEAADKKLNSVYGRIRNEKDTNKWKTTTVTRDGIRDAQRAWIKYRDAWVVFAAVRCPQVAAASLKTILTEERTRQLEEFFEELD